MVHKMKIAYNMKIEIEITMSIRSNGKTWTSWFWLHHHTVTNIDLLLLSHQYHRLLGHYMQTIQFPSNCCVFSQVSKITRTWIRLQKWRDNRFQQLLVKILYSCTWGIYVIGQTILSHLPHLDPFKSGHVASLVKPSPARHSTSSP